MSYGWFSIYKVYITCKAKGIEYNPFEVPVYYYLGSLLGAAMTILIPIYLIAKYLP